MYFKPVVVICAIAAFSSLTFAGVGSAQQAFITPLPADSRVIAPPTNVPPDVAAFSGKWAGTTPEGYKVGLVVEQITPPSAIVVYSWGNLPNSKDGWMRYYAEIANGKLRFQTSYPAAVTFTMRRDGRLDFDWEAARGSVTAVIAKVSSQ